MNSRTAITGADGTTGADGITGATGAADATGTAIAGGRVSRYDRWIFRTMNDPRTKGHHATRAARRGYVLLHIAATITGVTAGVLSYWLEQPWWAGLVFAALLVLIPVTGMLNSSTRGLLELRTHMLDERQQAERGTVHTLAHRVTRWAMAAAFLGFMGGHIAGIGLDGLAAPLAATGIVLLALHRLLPLWIAALRVEDEPEDDDVLGLDDTPAHG